jgi:hypothetical protein
MAQVSYDLGVTSQYEHDSNVFDLPTGYTAPGLSSSERADSYYTYGAKGDLKYLWSQQSFNLALSGTEYRYDRFSQLNHSEYAFNGGWDFKFGSDWDGNVNVSRNRSMVPFSEVYQSAIALQTEQRESADIGFHFAPDWRIEASGYSRALDEPLVGAPNLELKEYDGKAVLQFVGVSHLTAGAGVDYLSGEYSGTGTITGANAILDPDYRQITESVVAKYVPSDISSIDASFGYSKRSSTDALNSVSGATGSLTYHRALTGKTSVALTVSRAIIAYIADNGSEIDSTADARVVWQATYKTGVSLGYTYTYRNLPGQGALPGDTRIDHVELATLNIDYEPFRWLSVKPYANVQTRRSDVVFGSYNATVYGINVTLQMMQD